MNQRDRIILWIVLGVLMLWGVHWLNYRWVAPAKPSGPGGPIQYQYLTFRWPKDTQTAALIYSRQATNTGATTVSGEVTEAALKLADILARARQLAGYEYCGAVSDTFILRRVAPGLPDAAAMGGPDLFVLPAPPPNGQQTGK